MNPRDEINLILERTGPLPPLDVRALERSVRARLDVAPAAGSRSWWRSWTTGGLVAAGLAVGVLSAAWRMAPGSSAETADGHARYLQLIDPLARADAGASS